MIIYRSIHQYIFIDYKEIHQIYHGQYDDIYSPIIDKWWLVDDKCDKFAAQIEI